MNSNLAKPIARKGGNFGSGVRFYFRPFRPQVDRSIEQTVLVRCTCGAGDLCQREVRESLVGHQCKNHIEKAQNLAVGSARIASHQ